MTATFAPIPAQSSRLALRIDDVNVDVQGPSDIIARLASILRRHRRSGRKAGDVVRGVTVRVARTGDPAALEAQAALERIVRAAAEIATREVIRAAALEREGRALLIAGAARSGRSTLAAHFLVRGWRLLADDLAIIAGPQPRIVPNHTLMSLGASCVPHLPSHFREALERSHWYSDGTDLRFYEVDPQSVCGPPVWSDGGRLDAIVFLDRAIRESGVQTLSEERGAALLERAGVSLRSPSVRMGAAGFESAARCAQSIESWYDAHATP